MKKTFYLTIDLEEWYHLLYFKKYTQFKGVDFFVLKMDLFLEFLKQHQIKATFFVLAEVAEKHQSLIKRIYNHGHEIACHGYNHGLVNEKSADQFVTELRRAKKIIEEIIEDKIYGYRAPCFSLTDETIWKLHSMGFSYDSSHIEFSDHKLYSELDMSKFRRLNSILWRSEDPEFFEFQIPTTKLFNLKIPISGGGYLRIIPFFIFRYLFKSELLKRDEYMLFLHPFELYPDKFQLPIKPSLRDKLRYCYRRKTNLKRLSRLLNLAKKMGFEFSLMNPKN